MPPLSTNNVIFDVRCLAINAPLFFSIFIMYNFNINTNYQVKVRITKVFD